MTLRQSSGLSERYESGLDILGIGVGDFVPWLGIVGKVAGGLGGGGDDKGAAQQAQALREAQEAARRAEERARTTQMIMLGGLGFVALGGILIAVLKK